MADLVWYPASSADKDHPDEEVDLVPLGCPGGGLWAYVADEGGRWEWGVLDHWLWEDNEDGEDARYVVRGTADTKDVAKQAVSAWVGLHVTV